MKKIALFIAVLLNMTHVFSQVIPNGNFETWDLYNTWTLEPQYWSTQNNQIVTPVTPDSIAHEGDYAMRVHVLPGFEGGLQEIAHTSLPVDFIPNALTYWVKASVPDGYDLENVTVTAAFFHSGTEVYTEMDVIYDSIPEWEQHTILFDQIDIAVDEVRLLVSAGFVTPLGGGSWDTWISVDDMAFDDGLFVNGLKEKSMLFFPNPCSGQLNLSQFKNGDILQIADSSGRLIIDQPATRQTDLSSLSDGEYVARLITPDGCLTQMLILRK